MLPHTTLNVLSRVVITDSFGYEKIHPRYLQFEQWFHAMVVESVSLLHFQEKVYHVLARIDFLCSLLQTLAQFGAL